MKDRIGNVLEMGQKVVVSLPEAQIFGFVAQLEQGGLITGIRAGGASKRMGRVLVSCVIALPCDPEEDAVAQWVRVYDPDKHEGSGERPN